MTTYLAKTKLDKLTSWLDDNGFAHRPGKGQHQALQIHVENDGWQVLYFKNDAPNHLKVGEKLSGLIERFLREA